MSKVKKISKSAKKLSAPKTDQILPIRKSYLGEAFYPTGNGLLRQCLHSREIVGQLIFAERYITVEKASFSPAMVWSDQVLFREVVSENGERFAYPQILNENPKVQDNRAECEKVAFSVPYGHWITIDECEGCDDLFHSSELTEEDHRSDSTNFAQRLNEALSAHVIDSEDHPLMQIFQKEFEGVMDELLQLE